MPYKIENGRLVEYAAESPNDTYIGKFKYDFDNDKEVFTRAKSYAVLPEHLPIFEAMGTVEDGDFEVKEIECHANRDGDCNWKDCPQAKNWQSHCPYDLTEPDEPAPIYAIPKAKNEDVWEEVKQRFEHWLFENGDDTLDNFFSDIQQHYNLTRKK